MPSIPIILLIATLAALIVWTAVQSERKRAASKRKLEERFATLAQELGGEFFPHGFRKRDDWSADGRRRDVRFLKSLPYLDLLVPIESARIENLIAVREGQTDIYAFELVPPPESNQEALRKQMVVVRLTSRLPGLFIWPVHSPLLSTTHSYDLPTVGTEWAEFNRRYKVRSAIPREAHGLLTPEIMELLVLTDPCHWAIGGCYLYATPYGSTEWTKRSTPAERVEEVRAHLAVVREVASLIPSYILEAGETRHRWASPLE
jgi:hypothetical protein